MRWHKIAVTTTGSAGSASGTASSTYPICGEVYAVHIDYTSQPGTTDVTIATAGATHPAVTLLTLTNANTDTVKYPRVAVHNTSGTGVEYASSYPIYGCIPIADAVTVTVAQGDAVTDGVVVWIVYED